MLRRYSNLVQDIKEDVKEIDCGLYIRETRKRRNILWLLLFDGTERFDDIKEKTTRYNDLATPTFKKWLAERINMCIYEIFFAGRPPRLDFLF